MKNLSKNNKVSSFNTVVQERMNRRKFIKKTAIGSAFIAGAGCKTLGLDPLFQQDEKSTLNKIVRTIVPNTGVYQ